MRWCYKTFHSAENPSCTDRTPILKCLQSLCHGTQALLVKGRSKYNLKNYEKTKQQLAVANENTTLQTL